MSQRSSALALVTLALGTIAPAGAWASDPGAFAEAQTRADRYLDAVDPVILRYQLSGLLPKITALAPAISECKSTTHPPPGFKLKAILSFQDGRFDRALSDNDTPFAVCMIDALARVDWPTPPAPDFAHELSFTVTASR